MSFHTSADKDAALRALDQITDPRSGKGLAAAGLVQGLVLREGRAGFMLEVPVEEAARYAPVREAAEKVLAGLPGIEKAQVVLTASAPEGVTRQRRGARVAPDAKAELKPRKEVKRPENVKRVIAVASGKGGVGKSTVAVNLACAFAALGQRVGLLDADVYGPSAPRMMGVDGEPLFIDGKLQPLTAHGVTVMSIGFLVDEGSPMIWRGPMASSAVRQMVNDVRWATPEAPLDILVIDMPPGTGDIHLTLVENFAVDGVVIVSTPQEIALIDARRAVGMFQKTGAKILGVIENMAFFADRTTGAHIPIFGTGGARAEADKLGVPLLAEIPIEVALRQAGDEGAPLTASGGTSAAAEAFRAAAKALL
ncbi:MAG: Mrp/NBP35 family ATP-binding protein [Caulobacterales bacterium]|nr:Mrp/NBP35 family ATP-binding protein [Caulobacterales bacterium]